MDCDTLDTLQANIALTAAIGNIAGDKIILTGCELTDNGTQRSEGYLFVRTKAYPNGEVLYWKGGNISEGMHIETTNVAVSAHGYDYPAAYTKRILVAGVGEEKFKWEDFVRPTPSAELNARIAELTTRQNTVETKVESAEPLGVIKMWAGVKTPDGYMLCDGTALPISEYPELYAAISYTFNESKDKNGVVPTVESGRFCLPDLRGRFIVGLDKSNDGKESDDEYAKCGNTGGEKMHTLTVKEMPKHSHGYSIYQKGSKDRQRFSEKKNNDSDEEEARMTSEIGEDNPHENRPPYYVLAYIMKVR